MSEDKLHRAGRWKAFYDEEGGLRDVLDGMCQAYFERHASLGVKEHDKQYALSLANKVARELQAHIVAIIETGKLEEHRAHARRIEELPAATTPQRQTKDSTNDSPFAGDCGSC